MSPKFIFLASFFLANKNKNTNIQNNVGEMTTKIIKMKNSTNPHLLRQGNKIALSLRIPIPQIISLFAHMADIPSAKETVVSTLEGGTEIIGSTMHSMTDAGQKSASKSFIMEIPRPLRSTAGDSTDLSIKHFLSKPIEFASGTFASTDTVSTFGLIGVFDPIAQTPMLANKLAGVFCMRATTCVTVQVNATRFQQGRYIVFHLPNGGAVQGSTADVNHTLMHTFTRMQVTQLPHVGLDLSKDTQVQLKIPYSSWMNATPCINASAPAFVNGTPGKFGLYTYASLVAVSGSTNASYTMWVHYEDIELFGNMGPQMGEFKGKRSTSSKGDFLAQEQAKTGPIEGGAKIVKNIADALAPVPFLSTLAAPISWVSDAVAGVSSFFGWSKPLQLSAVNRVRLEAFTGFPNADVADGATSLSLFAGNRVDVLPGFAATEVDELSIDYIKDIYSYFEFITWNTSTLDGATLLSLPLNPLLFTQFPTDTTNQLISMTPMAYLASNFRFWRGGFRIRILLVKTEFHSGRLMVCYFPSTNDSGAAPAIPTEANNIYVHKNILDIRDANEFEIEIPFVSPTSWLPTGNVGATSISNAPTIGTLSIFVLHPLEAPSTVSPGIIGLIEVKAAADMEFAFPISSNMVPIVPLAIQMGDFNNLTIQMNDGIVLMDTIGTAESVPKDYSHSAACQGEAVSSLRVLLKRPTYYTIFGQTVVEILINPDVSQIMLNRTPLAPVLSSATHDFYTHLSCIYALQRGGNRFKLHSLNTAPAGATFQSFLTTCGTNAVQAFVGNTSATLTQSQLSLALEHVTRYDWGYDISIPQYYQNHSQPTVGNIAYTISAPNFGELYGTTNKQLVVHCGVQTGGIVCERYGSDDCNFGLFVGIPPFYLNTNA